MTLVVDHPHPLAGRYRVVGYNEDSEPITAPASAPANPAAPSTAGSTLFLVAVGLGAIVSGIALWEKLR